MASHGGAFALPFPQPPFEYLRQNIEFCPEMPVEGGAVGNKKGTSAVQNMLSHTHDY